MSNFNLFMKRETFFYSPYYAKNRVVIHGENNILDCDDNGAILLFLHYGSFFLSGGAIVHQLNLPFTLIASTHNLNHLQKREKRFWVGVHQRSENLYGNALLNSRMGSRKLLDRITKSLYVGIAIDVIEYGIFHKKNPYRFMGKNLFFQTSAQRIARICNKMIVPMVIQYDVERNIHNLHFGNPLDPNTTKDATQKSLDFISSLITENQFFHDLDHFE